MSRPRFVIPVAAIALLSIASAPAETPSTQLDHIEQKLDTLLQRLDQPSPGQATGVQSAVSPGQTSPSGRKPLPSPATETMAAGVVAIIHPAPVTPAAAREIPVDAVGGFTYTGGSIQLADLTARGVRYAGLTGVDLVHRQGTTRQPGTSE
jgi:hypothetical protein